MRNGIGKLASAGVVALLALSLVTGAAAADGVSRPDDRAIHGPGALGLDQVRDFARPDDRATHGPGAIAAEQPVIARPTTSSSFHWDDAAIGALSMLGAVLVVAGCSVIALGRRPETV